MVAVVKVAIQGDAAVGVAVTDVALNPLTVVQNKK